MKSVIAYVPWYKFPGRMRLTLISPRIAVQKGDFLGSGIPYWPVELATLAAFLEEHGDRVDIIDLFGAAPGRLAEMGDYFLQGAPLESYLETPAIRQSEGFILFALSYMSHRELLEMARVLKAACPSVPVAILENSQAVTAYSIPRLSAGFFAAGVDALLCGEPYFNWDEIADCLRRLDPADAPGNVVLRDHPADRPVGRRTAKQSRYPVPGLGQVQYRGVLVAALLARAEIRPLPADPDVAGMSVPVRFLRRAGDQ